MFVGVISPERLKQALKHMPKYITINDILVYFELAESDYTKVATQIPRMKLNGYMKSHKREGQTMIYQNNLTEEQDAQTE